MYQVLLDIQYVSILALFVESWIVFRKWNGALHSYLFLSCIATLVNNVGYLVAMQAQSEELYIAALQFTYLGKVWIPYSLFFFAMLLCKIHVPRGLHVALSTVPFITFALMMTVDKNKLYYRDYRFEKSGLFPRLWRVSGVWHYFYDALLVVLIAYGLVQIILAWRREHGAIAKKRLLMVSFAFMSESAFFGLYKLNIARGYDVTVLGYTIGAFFMLVAIFRYDLLDTEALARRFVIDQLSEAIIAVDDRGEVSYYNKPARALLPELADKPQEVMDRLRAAIDGGAALTLGERVYTPERNALTLDGTEIGTLYALTDDTEHYRYMAELREQKELADSASRAKTDFLANMSHEIRTPINAILGMDEMILRECGEQETLAYAEDIQSAGKTLLSLINDILDFSKVEQGKMEILPTQYDLSSVINDLVNMILPRAEDKGLRFVMDVDETTPHLLIGDEIRIRQCALNILTNAVKYTEKGSVTMALGYDKISDGKIALRFRITDTGIGIKPEAMDKLFSPFDRIEEKRNRSIEGTGLGMSITRQLLDLMGSRLEVQSVYGEGSTFAFAIEQEVVDWEGVGRLTCSLDQSGGKRKDYRELFHAPEARILVVDDTPVNLTVIRGLLKKTQVQVDTAESGREALTRAARSSYDVIFIDHMMPGMDGIETLRELRKLPELETTPCVALTANAISGAREMYLEAGFTDYLSKPVEGAKLEKLLMSCLPPEKVFDPAKTPAAPPVPADTATVLVADDDPLTCRLVGEILGKSFHVESCQSGAEARSAALRLRPDLILLDINLGDMTGFDVLRALRVDPATDTVPVIFLTGESDEAAEIEGFRIGAADFVRKPVVPEVLLQRARRIILLDRLQRGLQGEVRRQTRRAERLTKEMMLALSRAVDAKDHYTNGHSQRVAAYAAEIARRMGKNPRKQEQIYEMGLLHDIGKIGVPEEIINKTSRLTDEEFARIKSHTVIGSEILSLITEMPELSDGARSHHERYGGGGYPDGLAGEDIPEAARIICLADCYDAMTSTRTYSQPKEQSAVRAEIERCAGTQFDPEIAKVLLAMIDEDKDYVMTERTADIHVWRGSGKLWSADTREEERFPSPLAGVEATTAEEPDVELPEWLHGVADLDTDVGLRHCGTEEIYLETLTIYAKSAPDIADEIEGYWRDGNVADTTVKVHALKSTSRAIGAEKLGALAEKLENAGKEGDTATLGAELGTLLEEFRALAAALSPLYAQKAPDESLPPIPDDKLREAYDAVREFAANYDSEGVAYILHYLDGFRVPDSERERVQRLRDAADSFDWDRIGEIMRE